MRREPLDGQSAAQRIEVVHGIGLSSRLAVVAGQAANEAVEKTQPSVPVASQQTQPEVSDDDSSPCYPKWKVQPNDHLAALQERLDVVEKNSLDNPAITRGESVSIYPDVRVEVERLHVEDAADLASESALPRPAPSDDVDALHRASLLSDPLTVLAN